MARYWERHREGLLDGRKVNSRPSVFGTAFLVKVCMVSLRTANSHFGYTRRAASSKLRARKSNDGGNSRTSQCSLRFLTHSTAYSRAALPSWEPQDLPMGGCGLLMVSYCKRSIQIIWL